MHQRDYKDVIGGTGLITIGLFATYHAVDRLPLGTVVQMGPGMFPAALGLLIAGTGAIILAMGLGRPGEAITVHWWPAFTVLLSILVFALLVRPFGLIPSILVLTFIASLADRKLSPLGSMVLGVVLAVTATLVFRVGLGIPLRAFAWPW